jgi:CPA2 family monovalent cation:H+ antiporter-2
MFGVGLHFSLKDLLSVRAIAIPGAIVQIAPRRCWAGPGLAAGLVDGAPASSSASRCRSPAPWCCCARCRSGG